MKKKQRSPLTPRIGPYKTVNTYTLRVCFEYACTLILMIVLIVLHSIFIVPAIVKLNNVILWWILALQWVILLIVIVLYIIVTLLDPVDGYILDRYEGLKDSTKKYCLLCRSYVKQRSYHCKRCNRCTQNFDHHCKYLNCCIGGKNYVLFLLLLIFFMIFNVTTVANCIWVLVQASKQNQQINNFPIVQQISIFLIAICCVLIIICFILCLFHFYISLCLQLSTLQFMDPSSQSSSSHNNDKKQLQGSERGLTGQKNIQK